MQKEIANLLDNKFVIYGNGTIAHLLYALLKEKNKEKMVAAFIVSECTKEDKYIDVPIRNADKLRQEYADYPVLVGVENKKAKAEITKNLENMGIFDYILLNDAMINACYAYEKKCRKRKLYSIFGVLDGIIYRIAYYLHKRVYIKFIGKRIVAFKIFGKYKLFMRLFSRDLDFFESIYIGSWTSENKYIGEYDFELKECDTVFDFGANIGLFTIKFAPFFPQLKFIAVEPELSNYRLLKRNLGFFHNTECMKNGVWYRDTYCKVHLGRTIVFPSNTFSEGSFYIEECQQDSDNAVEVFSIASWIKKFNSQKCVIKMDIEGAEKEIFELGELGWLEQCVQLIIEIHSRHREDDELDNKIINIMENHGFKKFQLGENFIFEK